MEKALTWWYIHLLGGRNTCTIVGETDKKELVEWCMLLEAELGNKLYFGGDAFGFVDIASPCSLLQLVYFIVFKKFANFNLETECPKLVMFEQRLCIYKSLPTSKQVYQAYLEFKRGWAHS
uniref:Glutathione S-transferase U20-like n=1 Tax=Nicotiana sylvestris TaxID=4096 RepID=A0A1U7X1Q9_NICSY|nr:PREDICTED: glutathione S-transferase U20-like [Nicotiana sylvestris]